MTLNLNNGGQRTLDSKSAIPKTYICIFLDFFIVFFFQKQCIEPVKFSFFKRCSGWIGGMRVVRLGWNWLFILCRYCRNFFEFIGPNLSWSKTSLRDPPPLNYCTHIISQLIFDWIKNLTYTKFYYCENIYLSFKESKLG